MGKTSKDKRDIYYRLAKEQGWRARSAFKLLQLDEEYGLLEGVCRVVDLCAAPGSWSQVLARRFFSASTAAGANTSSNSITATDSDKRRIVAVDLQPMAPIDGVALIQGDITQPSTAAAVLAALAGPADLVLCDGAPDVTGLHAMDEYLQSQLLLSALIIALRVSRPGATFVAKMFRGATTTIIYLQLRMLFAEVSFCKPASSRASSYECFVVAKGLAPDGERVSVEALAEFVQGRASVQDLQLRYGSRERQLVPFIAHGDISGLDSDTTYELPEGHRFLDPVQPPTAPPYYFAACDHPAGVDGGGGGNDDDSDDSDDCNGSEPE